MTVLVTTPTGNVGSRVVDRLLEDDADVHVFVRNPDTLAPGVRNRVTVHRGDLTDRVALTTALDGADALFFLIPPNYQATDMPAFQRRIAQNGAAAIRATGVDRVVFLSSAGAHRTDHGGPVASLGKAERVLKGAASNLVCLRPGFFMENFLSHASTIAREGAMYHAYDPDVPGPMVATRDVGDVAASWLLDLGWMDTNYVGIHGPRDLTHADAASIIGDVLGREVRYVQVPLDAVVESFRDMGATPSVQESMRAMIEGFMETQIDVAEPRTPETTTPTTLAEFTETVMKPAIAAATRPAKPA